MEAVKLLSDFLTQPAETIELWLDSTSEAIGVWWQSLLTSATIGVTHFLVEGIAVIVIVYAVYCACRVMLTMKDETFSEYINKSMIAGLGYFFARYGGNIILKLIGA